MSLERFGLSVVALGAIAVGVMACSDPALPPSDGAWRASFQSPTAKCTIASHNAMVGDVGENTRTSVVSDGVDGATLSCTVAKTADGYSVQASASRKGNTLSIAVASLDPGATEANPSKGRVAFTSVTSQKSYYGDAEHPCDFYFAPNTKQSVASGKVWVTFSCPTLIGENDVECAMGRSYALFENCDE